MATSMDPSAILGQLTGSYMKLPLVQKIMFPLLVFGSVMGLVYVSKWANKAEYAVLFSDLKPADSAAVINKLKEKKIKYEVRGSGDTIAITPPEMVHETRMELAGDGVPRGGTVGLEIFEAANLGTTTFQEKIKFQRAIQGELERTISSLRGVVGARVHIAQPEKSVFSKKGSEPTASVMLQLDPGSELEKKQIKGISNLVAGSIEGLKRENVTIIDVNGNLLSGQEENEENLGIEATRLQYQKEIERSYIQRVEQMLAKVLGDGKVIARVTADLDYSQTEREEESYDAGGQVLRSERTVEEGSGSTQRGGVPGVVSNMASDANLLTAPGAGEKSARREAVKNYEVSRAVSKTSLPRGKLTRLSVAVLVDGSYEAAPGAPASAPKAFKALDSETMGRIESVVKSATGYDASRGDTITVENIPFHVSNQDFTKEMESKRNTDMIFNGIFRAGPVLFVVLFFLLIVKPIVKFLTTPTDAEVDLTRLLPTGIQELEREMESERSRAASVPESESTVDLDQLGELMSENSRLVKENPQQAALLIRYWLNDGRL